MRHPEWRNRPVTGQVVTGRTMNAVYGFHRHFSNLPRFLGDVSVERVGSSRCGRLVRGALGSRIPATLAVTAVTAVTADRADRRLRYRPGGPPPLRAPWESFAAVGGATGRWEGFARAGILAHVAPEESLWESLRDGAPGGAPHRRSHRWGGPLP